MKMTMMELMDILGGRMRITLNDSLTEEQRAVENEQTKLIIGLGTQFINGANFTLNAEKHLAQIKALENSKIKKIIGD